MLYIDNRKLIVIKKSIKKSIKFLKEIKNSNLKMDFLKANKLSELLNLKNAKGYIKVDFKRFNINNISNSIQEKIEKIFKSKNKDLSLTQSNIWMQSITGGLLSGTIFGIAWLSFAKTEEIIIVTGKLEPSGGVRDIQIPFQGVAKDVLIKEGQIVEKNQVLINLDTEINKSKQRFLNETLIMNEEILEKLSLLSAEGAIAKIQYLDQKNKVAEIKNRITENSVTLKYQQIKAPIKGFVFDLKPKKSGYVVQSGESMMKIIPLNKLQAKVEINSEKIGFIRVGQKAAISIDSYPSTDFGVIEGEVISIGSDALSPNPSLNKGYRFPAEIKIKNQFLTIKNGTELPLQAGMSLSANIKLRKVSYLQLLLGTFSDKADSLRAL